MSQIELMKKRRFAPLFWTQVLGALNDNLFKNAMVIMMAFKTVSQTEMSSSLLVNLAAGIFILPFVLLSATAGQIADKFEKSQLIRAIKAVEIAVMLLATLGFVLSSIPLLFCVLFLMGAQSAFFGPVKYSILPQHLRDDEIVGGNGLVEMGTFLAILLGTIFGGILVAIDGYGSLIVSAAVILIAVAGYLTSRAIPKAHSGDPSLRINTNPFGETYRLIGLAREERAIFLSILGISWFWAFGSIFLAQFPGLIRETFGGDENLVVLFLSLFSLGIGIGSVLCERMSNKRIELGLVPFGSIGLTLFGVDLFFALPTAPVTVDPVTVTEFVCHSNNWRFIFDLSFIGVFGGFYIVPLYAMLQQRSNPKHRSRIIAANNIINALFIVAAAGVAIVLRSFGMNAGKLLLSAAVFNTLVAIYIYRLLPEFLVRFIFWILIHTVYRIRKIDFDRIPDQGPALIVCNHVSFVDALIIGVACPKPIRFVIDHRIYRMPVLNYIFRIGRCIPITSRRDNRDVTESAFEEIALALQQGDIVCIFPEGRITSTGEVKTFKPGVEQIVKRTPVPVYPVALRGLWGSFFSRKEGPAMRKLPKRFLSKIELVCGAPVPPHRVSAAALESNVRALVGDRT